MNATSRAILQTIVTTDDSLSAEDRGAIQRLLDGRVEPVVVEPQLNEPLLLTQKMAATLLSVSRVTVWRLTKERRLHPVEILPGTWRYAYGEIAKLAQAGFAGLAADPGNPNRTAVAA